MGIEFATKTVIEKDGARREKIANLSSIEMNGLKDQLEIIIGSLAMGDTIEPGILQKRLETIQDNLTKIQKAMTDIANEK